MGERCALNAPGQASGSGLESSPSPSHGSTGTGTSQSLGPSDRELIELARELVSVRPSSRAGYDAYDETLTALADRLEALASRPAVAEGWVLVQAVPGAAWLTAIEEAARAQWGDTDVNHRIGYRIHAALLSAAPKP